MKKLFGLILATVMAFALPVATACNGGGGSTSTSQGGEGTQPSQSSGSEQLPENKEVGGEELINTLISSPYKSAIANNQYGLSDASPVGAGEEAFNRVLYPVPESGFAHTYVAAEHGITLDGEKNEKNLNALIESLKDVEGLKQIVFEKGTYRFTTTIKLDGIEDLYLVGNGTEFVFDNWCIAYSIRNCKNIHFNDISTDYDPSPVVAGTVKSCDTNAKTITISLADEFDLSDSRYNNGTINYGSYMEFTEGAFGELYPNYAGNLLYNSTGDNVKNIEAGKYNAASNELTLTFKTMRSVAAGTRVSVAFTMYEFPTFDVKECENMYLEGCNIYCSAGMTFMFHSVTNSYLNRTNLMLKAGSERLMTATADGFHGNDCCGDIVITGSIYENSHDDSINICSFYKKITQNAAKEIVCEASSPATNFPIEEGDKIEVYDPTTFELKGSYTVVSVHKALLKYTLTVDKYVRDDLKNLIVGNVTRSPKVHINDCFFRNKRNRGILLQSRDSDISGNTFYNIVHGSISLHSALDIFAEAIVPGNVTVSNNKFISNNHAFGLDGDISIFAYGPTYESYPGSIKNINVNNNFIYNNGQAGISYKAAGDSRIYNNLIYNPAFRSSGGDRFSAIRVVISEDITIKDNCVIVDEERDGFNLIAKDEISVISESGNVLKLFGGII